MNVSEAGFKRRTLSAAESAGDRAAFHAVMKRPVEARKLAQESMRADAACPSPYEVEGLLCDQEDAKEPALAAYSRAVALGSDNFYAYYRHAQLLWNSTLDTARAGADRRRSWTGRSR
ncbi:MAG: hypothetical protein MZW92_53675 [Comamonadaceae bacterium]|nr:hypothetical protein [Comamonadaceae bacterium]